MGAPPSSSSPQCVYVQGWRLIDFPPFPPFSPRQVPRLDLDVKWARALDGTEYMPGLVGLNNMRANDYANVIVHILARVAPVRCGAVWNVPKRGLWGYMLGR